MNITTSLLSGRATHIQRNTQFRTPNRTVFKKRKIWRSVATASTVRILMYFFCQSNLFLHSVSSSLPCLPFQLISNPTQPLTPQNKRHSHTTQTHTDLRVSNSDTGQPDRPRPDRICHGVPRFSLAAFLLFFASEDEFLPVFTASFFILFFYRKGRGKKS